ncbi:Fe-Mn family superoxide dismutase [Clostridium acetobutylicum]|uniref:superoxide dismutase n=1 Tax=Clostridium acetobutylicum (strain ATCC 824 / DSM 792 / JCM 1419 / IAM 19013 / LMG 5710 / NBRC 13948 / NRRL B-527 / VKM B-1787 / 2291 / W) TaxID=272562 RepID=Q97G07_CLOAB|nr:MULTISPECIES: Fe-Mn family superoxide dismutase [Clostridium]AAK80516.1 Superoxide dismutase (Fe/Mn family) [Clostridium acetobutylicum ATCC 824]ADZ21615.1 Superoxide dismutase (Fe/Mn family) [Clostridium acetobutylicum EA 2018]AEI33162.1 Fe/Mn family superoxide dismutase [Clostridium acetobutylicum DSM 1731]AWV79066.1 superoxide dismutase [Clostridium acetobutylicum]MBC2394973.1 superoxide dismutase [Clostridium acetobutylicum]
MITEKKYNFNSLAGFSNELLKAHYDIYVNYINDLNKLWKVSYTPGFRSDDTNHSLMRSLKSKEIYTLNGIKLHELYFENMTGKNTKPYGPILKEIGKQFSSYNNFISYLTEVAISMKGWVILSIDSLDGRFHLFGNDFHDTSAILASHPLMVLDVQEHSYFKDFINDKGKYVETFINNLDWKILNDRFKAYIFQNKLRTLSRSDGDFGVCPFMSMQDTFY